MTETMHDPNSFLMSSGVPSFKFDTIGATAKGPIVSLEMQQQRDIDTNQPMTWEDGKPRMQLRIVLATDTRDNDEDDGHRAVYVKGQMQAAIRDAIKTAGQTQIVEGGILAVKYEKDGEKKKAAHNPPKQYRAQYQPPAPKPAAVDADDLL